MGDHFIDSKPGHFLEKDIETEKLTYLIDLLINQSFLIF